MLKAFSGTDIYRPDDLPDIDVLIITHEHWDHMEYATLRDIRDRVQHVICPLGIADYLRYWGYKNENITEMDYLLAKQTFLQSFIRQTQSDFLGIFAFSSLWGIGEVFHQRERVRKGWFPMNPKRKDDYPKKL